MGVGGFIVQFLFGCTPDQGKTPIQKKTDEISGGNSFSASLPPTSITKILNLVIDYENTQRNEYDYKNFRNDYIIDQENRLLLTYLNAEILHYYPKSFSGTGAILDNDVIQKNIWFPPSTTWLILSREIISKLNSQQIAETFKPGARIKLDNFDLEVFQLQTSYVNSKNTYLVDVKSGVYNIRGWIPVTIENGSLELIQNDIEHTNEYFSAGITLHIIPDINGDSLRDIVIHKNGELFGSSMSHIAVYGTTSGKIKLLRTIQIKQKDKKRKPFEITQTNNNQHLMQISVARTNNFGCDWIELKTYQWIDTLESINSSQPYPPESVFCKIANAVSPTNNINIDQKIVQLEEASKSNFPFGNDYKTLLLVHLAAAYAAKGELELSKTTISTINTIPDGYPFSDYVKNKILEADGSPVSLCQILFSNNDTSWIYRSELSQYLNPSTLFNSYGSEKLNILSSILCPYNLIIENLPALFEPQKERHPFFTLHLLGLRPQILSIEINFDSEKQTKILTLLNGPIPALLYFDKENNIWNTYLLKTFSSPIASAQWEHAETSQNTDYLKILFEQFDPTGSKCNNIINRNQITKIFTFSFEENSLNTEELIVCLDPELFFEYSGEQIKAIAEKQQLESPQGFSEQQIQDELQRLEEKFQLSYSFHEIDVQIQTLLSIPSLSSVNHQYLTFLTGVNFEYSGYPETAYIFYKETLLQDSTSIWGIIAQEKLYFWE